MRESEKFTWKNGNAKHIFRGENAGKGFQSTKPNPPLFSSPAVKAIRFRFISFLNQLFENLDFKHKKFENIKELALLRHFQMSNIWKITILILQFKYFLNLS